MKVAALQWNVERGRVGANLQAAEAALAEAVAAGAELVVLPEVWATSFPTVLAEPGLLDGAARGEGWAERVSREHGLVVAGTHLADAGEGRCFNRLTIWDGGVRLLEYDKLHLFTPTAEHELFRAGGAAPPVVESRVGRIAGVVCYDLRFGELFSRFVEAGVDWVVCPAQWPVARAGHWEALVLGRAVECQAGVVAANRTGSERIGRQGRELEFGGNSLIADGHGRWLGRGLGPAGAVVGDVDVEALRKLRIRVPVRKDRRADVYRGWAEAGE